MRYPYAAGELERGLSVARREPLRSFGVGVLSRVRQQYDLAPLGAGGEE